MSRPYGSKNKKKKKNTYTESIGIRLANEHIKYLKILAIEYGESISSVLRAIIDCEMEKDRR